MRKIISKIKQYSSSVQRLVFSLAFLSFLATAGASQGLPEKSSPEGKRKAATYLHMTASGPYKSRKVASHSVKAKASHHKKSKAKKKSKKKKTH